MKVISSGGFLHSLQLITNQIEKLSFALLICRGVHIIQFCNIQLIPQRLTSTRLPLVLSLQLII